MLPQAILFDLDDTLIQAYGGAEAAWLAVTHELVDDLAPLTPSEVAEAVGAFARSFWADPERHRRWRMRLSDARREIVAGSFAVLASTGRRVPPAGVAQRLADRFSAYRDAHMRLFPDAHKVIDALRVRGTRLALVTNGASEAQRAKIDRFDLASRFDHIQIEGEHEFGKPDERAYRHALRQLGADARDTWMVGDNLEWEVAAPQRLGIVGIWFDAAGKGLPRDTNIRPDRIVASLSELLPTEAATAKDPARSRLSSGSTAGVAVTAPTTSATGENQKSEIGNQKSEGEQTSVLARISLLTSDF
jgi:putative hydrolase of the HAD superfamily